MHEPFSPFYPDGTESKEVVVLPAVLPGDRILEHLGREQCHGSGSTATLPLRQQKLLSTTLLCSGHRRRNRGGGGGGGGLGAIAPPIFWEGGQSPP